MKNFLILFSLSFLFFSCDVDSNFIRGNGNVVTEARQIGEFHSIKSRGSIDIDITPSDSYSVEIQNDENLLQHMVVEVVEGVLEVKYERGSYSGDHAKVFVTVPTLTEIKSAGSADISIHGILKNAKQININLSGSGDLEGAVDAPVINAMSSGSGNIELSGNTKTFLCEIRGSGDVHCEDLKSENADIRVKGSADINVFASVSLKVKIAGSGNVYYSGNPPSPDITVSGSGKVRKED